MHCGDAHVEGLALAAHAHSSDSHSCHEHNECSRNALASGSNEAEDQGDESDEVPIPVHPRIMRPRELGSFFGHEIEGFGEHGEA